MSVEQLEANKALVRKFIQTVFNDHQVDAGLELMHENYIQHNQKVPPGKEPMREAFKKGIETVSAEIKQMVAEGDRVVAQVHLKFDPESAGVVIVEIFRIEDGKLAEHWDVISPIPENPPFPKPIF